LRYFRRITCVSQLRFLGVALLSALAALPVHAGLIITPTFASSITSDANAAAIEATINSAIQVYENLFSNPITVSIDFTEMSSGLSDNTKPLDSISYSAFYSAYSTNAADNNDPAAQTALASGVVPNQTTNPVTGSDFMYASTANLLALGIPCGGCTLSGGYDGIVSINATVTNPGSSGSDLEYYLTPPVEHEIDEVLGLGSSLDQTYQTEYPSVEDLFRYASNGTRSYTTAPSALAYFSINGTTDLAQFDNQNDGGDWGDWQSNPLPTGVLPAVQDAFATPGADPSLGVEITALEAVGYDLAAPEPGTMGLLGLGFTGLGAFVYRRRHHSPR
jgi:hypothetical protein